MIAERLGDRELAQAGVALRKPLDARVRSGSRLTQRVVVALAPGLAIAAWLRIILQHRGAIAGRWKREDAAVLQIRTVAVVPFVSVDRIGHRRGAGRREVDRRHLSI